MFLNKLVKHIPEAAGLPERLKIALRVPTDPDATVSSRCRPFWRSWTI